MLTGDRAMTAAQDADSPRHRRNRRASSAQAPWEHAGVLVRPYVARLGTDVYASTQAGPLRGERWW
ncbi:hypothetical protein SUDANB105_01540 [Streptomyces sp. enrichment culture]